MFLTKEEKITHLNKYKEWLENEAEGVDEAIAKLKGEIANILSSEQYSIINLLNNFSHFLKAFQFRFSPEVKGPTRKRRVKN